MLVSGVKCAYLWQMKSGQYDDGILLSTRFLEAEVKKKYLVNDHTGPSCWAFFSTRLAFPFDLARLVLLIWSVLICCPKSVGPNLSLCFLYLPLPISSHYSLLPPGFASRPLLRHLLPLALTLVSSSPHRPPQHPRLSIVSYPYQSNVVCSSNGASSSRSRRPQFHTWQPHLLWRPLSHPR